MKEERKTKLGRCLPYDAIRTKPNVADGRTVSTREIELITQDVVDNKVSTSGKDAADAILAKLDIQIIKFLLAMAMANATATTTAPIGLPLSLLTILNMLGHVFNTLALSLSLSLTHTHTLCFSYSLSTYDCRGLAFYMYVCMYTGQKI